LYRGVISEKNIISDDGTYVTFQYKDSNTHKINTRREKGETFLWLMFQPVLPKGFRRVRDYGFLHGNAKKTWQLIQWLLPVIVPKLDPTPRPTNAAAITPSPRYL